MRSACRFMLPPPPGSAGRPTADIAGCGSAHAPDAGWAAPADSAVHKPAPAAAMPSRRSQRASAAHDRSADGCARRVAICRFGVGGGDIDDQSTRLHPTRQRQIEIAARVAMDAFYFAFGACPVRLAQARQESIQLGHVEEVVIPAVLTSAMRITLDDDALGVVVQDLARYAAQRGD